MLATVSLITYDSAQVSHRMFLKRFHWIAERSDRFSGPLRTHICVSTPYSGVFAVQTIIQRYHINKKWFFLLSSTGFFSYLYVRPLIRQRLGSASQAYINWSTIYILWLCSAVFYHTPSLGTLGIDVKADISLLLTIFLISCLVLGALHVAYNTGVTFNVVKPLLQDPSSRLRESVALVVLNALNLAMACSSFYALCGNAASVDAEGTSVDGVRTAICTGWLRPVPAMRHSAFQAWVIYGEETATSGGDVTENTISPIFTMWLTLFAIFVANCVADYASFAAITSAVSSQIRNMSKFVLFMVVCSSIFVY